MKSEFRQKFAFFLPLHHYLDFMPKASLREILDRLNIENRL